MKLTKNEWLKKYSFMSQRDVSLLERCYEVLSQNTIQGEKMPWGSAPVISPWSDRSVGIWNWDTAFHAMTVSRYDTELAKSCIDSFMLFQKDSGLLPDVIRANGRIEDDCGKPPVMPWAVCTVFEADGDAEFLLRNYLKLIKHEDFLVRERSNGGFFFYSSQSDPQADDHLHPRWESGWDNSPRWDKEPITMLCPIDLNCYMVLFYRSMSKMAGYLGYDDSEWREKERALSEKIEALLFDEKQKAYCDLNRETGAFSNVITPASFMPLFVGIASRSHAEAMAEWARSSSGFYPGMPTCTYDCDGYDNDYWRGPTWLNVAFFAIKGLFDYGYEETALEIKSFLLDMCYDELPNIYENYDSIERKGKCCPAFSWSAAFIIEMILQLP